jgi:AcrR family transcriptional regulator
MATSKTSTSKETSAGARAASAKASRAVSTADGGAGVGGPSAPVPRRLMAAATRLFADNGYDRTSVQEIVEAAGVTKGALYHYFGSKDDLLHEIYARLLRLQQERLDACADSREPVEQRLRKAAADVVVTTLGNLDDAMIFFRSMHQLSPEKQKQVRAERRLYHERFRALVEEGQRSGVFSAVTPPDLIVDYHFGSVHHLSSWYRPDGKLTPQEVAEHMADLLLRALRP